MKRRRRAERWIEHALYDSRCLECEGEVKAGQPILYFAGEGVMCEGCGEGFKKRQAEAKRRHRASVTAGGVSARVVYDGSDAALTRAFVSDLKKRGPAGLIAALLFKCQKSSRRAKMYGHTSYRGLAYGRKGESLKELCGALAEHGAALGISFGWGRDESSYNSHVLYIELPNDGGGEALQVSFHSPERFSGPDYEGEWDGKRLSEERIINFCQGVIAG